MNASGSGRASLRVRVIKPTIPFRGVQSKASRPKSTTKTPTRKQFSPELKRFEERFAKEAMPQPRPNGGISPRVLTFLGISALTISTYCGYLYASYQRQVSKGQTLDVPRDVSDRYNTTAPTFDADVELSEKAMGLGTKRANLVRMARGDVLEVSCGTGRNLEYYDLRRATRLTFVDLSPQMVAITKEKSETLRPGFKRMAFRAQDAGSVSVELDGLRRPGSKGEYYDTIVQTMGLCSMPDPVGTLRHLGEITEPKHGRILLLEHGRSYYDWLNRILDNLAPTHADRHGCWWNRDIGAIVRDSGLEIVEEKRWHLGTTWRYVLRPKQN
ncbi:hypothetical protein N7526_002388 [Penicillium atrosanguineum]|nr:hypothetical protein N7526_002388 [Penicillium atrosanguineum]